MSERTLGLSVIGLVILVLGILIAVDYDRGPKQSTCIFRVHVGTRVRVFKIVDDTAVIVLGGRDTSIIWDLVNLLDTVGVGQTKHGIVRSVKSDAERSRLIEQFIADYHHRTLSSFCISVKGIKRPCILDGTLDTLRPLEF